MARVLDEFPGPARASGGMYDKYLDGQVWELDLEKDFPGRALGAISSTLHHRAKKFGKKLRTKTFDKCARLVVQAYTPESEESGG